jgi:hypothetical protein
MDIKVTYTDPCPCGRGIIDGSMTCRECFLEDTAAFLEYMNGTINFDEFISLLGKKRRTGNE